MKNNLWKPDATTRSALARGDRKFREWQKRYYSQFTRKTERNDVLAKQKG